MMMQIKTDIHGKIGPCTLHATGVDRTRGKRGTGAVTLYMAPEANEVQVPCLSNCVSEANEVQIRSDLSPGVSTGNARWPHYG